MSKNKEKQEETTGYLWINEVLDSVLMGVASKIVYCYPDDLEVLGFDKQTLLEPNGQTLLEVLRKVLICNAYEDDKKFKQKLNTKIEKAKKQYALDGDKEKLDATLTKLDKEKEAFNAINGTKSVLSDILISCAGYSMGEIYKDGVSGLATTDEGPSIVISKDSVDIVDGANITIVYRAERDPLLDYAIEELRADYNKLFGSLADGTESV